MVAELKSIHDGTYVAWNDQTLKTFLLDRWLPIKAREITASTHSQYRRQIDTHIVPRSAR